MECRCNTADYLSTSGCSYFNLSVMPSSSANVDMFLGSFEEIAEDNVVLRCIAKWFIQANRFATGANRSLAMNLQPKESSPPLSLTTANLARNFKSPERGPNTVDAIRVCMWT